MSKHARGDVAILDEAIGYQTVALASASEQTRGDEQALLETMSAVRRAAEKEH
jgi:hypothetical protein